MKKKNNEGGNSIVVAVLTVAALSALVGIAVDYTSNVGRNAQRHRTIAKAVEIGDGSLELAFASWRKICSSQSTPTDPLTLSSFSAIPTPSPGNFPIVPDLTVSRQPNTAVTVSNFNVQPVDPLLTPLPAASPENKPTKSTGPGTGTFSYFYLASVDVTLPALKGSLTAKVRRVFEQRITSPWNWAMMFNDNMEISPASNLTLNGWVHTNGTLYTPTDKLTLTDRLTYVSDWNIGWDPNDTYHSGQTASAPSYPSEYPPGFEQPYIPFGWDPSTMINTTDLNPNNDSYRELIERASAATDAWSETRLYNQAAIAVEIDVNNNIRVFQGVGASKTDVTNESNSGAGGTAARAILGSNSGTNTPPSVTTGRAIQDNREQSVVRVVDFDLGQFIQTYSSSTTKSWNGIIYIRDNSAGTPVLTTLPGALAPSLTSKRAIRIINGSKVPSGGITIATENPIYVQGDFNTGRTSSREPPSNTGDPTHPTATGYTQQPSLIAADAISLLSNNWNDVNSTAPLANRAATNTTVNAALIGGTVPTNANGDGSYSGGAENFVRLLEDWSTNSNTFTYYGSMIQFYRSAQANQPWGSNLNTYSSPLLRWYFDKSLTTNSPPSTTKSQMATVSYLQQQRWYLTFQPNS
jgi:hypothetical protein